MAENIILDSIREVSSSEWAGVIVEATSVAIVEKNDATWPTDKSVMQTVYDLAGVPQPGDTFSPDHSNLIVRNRSCRMESPGRAEVTISYKFTPSSLNSDAQFDKLSSTLAQITTQRNRDGEEIVVSHGGNNQLGEISVLNPEDGFSREVYVSGIVPGDQHNIQTGWQAHVNSSVWNHGAAGTWLCLKALPDPLDIRDSQGTWSFIYQFEFAYDETGWQPQVFWRDPTTGRPPDGLEPGTGSKEVIWYNARDFNADP